MSGSVLWPLRYDRADELRTWLDAGGSVEAQECHLDFAATPAEWAAYYGELACLQLLAGRGAKCGRALSLALHSQQKHATEFLLGLGVQPVPTPIPDGLFIPLEHAFCTLAELELSVRVINRLETLGIQTLFELCQYSAVELLKIPRFGEKSLREVLDKLASRCLNLRDE